VRKCRGGEGKGKKKGVCRSFPEREKKKRGFVTADGKLEIGLDNREKGKKERKRRGRGLSVLYSITKEKKKKNVTSTPSGATSERLIWKSCSFVNEGGREGERKEENTLLKYPPFSIPEGKEKKREEKNILLCIKIYILQQKSTP